MVGQVARRAAYDVVIIVESFVLDIFVSNSGIFFIKGSVEWFSIPLHTGNMYSVIFIAFLDFLVI